MASTLFTYSPTTGSGNTNVSVTPTGNNTGTLDRVSVITFSGGGGTKSVTLTQHYRPYFLMDNIRFPASGGTETVTVYSKNYYFFHAIPSWITLKRNGQTVQPDSRIQAGEGVVYTITADENDSTNSRQSRLTFYLGFYTQDGDDAVGEYFLLQQAGRVETETVQIPLTVIFNTHASDNFSAILNLESYNGEECGTTLNFSSSTPAWIGSIGATVRTSGDTPLVMEVTVGTVGTDPGTYTNNIALDYGNDSLYETGSLGTTATFNTTYQSGEGITIEIDIVS